MAESANQDWFIYPRRVAYYETDAMGVVHHSNHIKYFEETRVAWLRDREMMQYHQPYGPHVFAVVAQECRYMKPAVFDEELEVWAQARLDGLKIKFQYALYSLKIKAVIATGSTVLVAIDKNLRPMRMAEALIAVFAREPWAEEWPPQLAGVNNL